tara:strand:+ start:188 stop:574 length:387 start_codon:yes stop_codon:yes gene_type:complete
MSFSDKVNNVVEENNIKVYKCDTCSKCKEKYFIHMNIDNSDKYVCSYLCSKDLHKKYNNYWDSVVNLEDFNKYPIPVLYTNNIKKFKINISPYDVERYEYQLEMEVEDRRIKELENYSDSSNSDYDSE